MKHKKIIYIPDGKLLAGYVSLGGIVIMDRSDTPIAGSPLMGLRIAAGDTLTITFKLTSEAQS